MVISVTVTINLDHTGAASLQALQSVLNTADRLSRVASSRESGNTTALLQP